MRVGATVSGCSIWSNVLSAVPSRGSSSRSSIALGARSLTRSRSCTESTQPADSSSLSRTALIRALPTDALLSTSFSRSLSSSLSVTATSGPRRAKLVERGRHWGPFPPLGYRRADAGTLLPDDEKAGIVRELFERRVAGESPAELARWLREQGVTTGRGGQPNRRWVLEILQNRAYLGEARSGELVNETAHALLVDPVTFDGAQATTGPRPTRGEEPALLSGLIAATPAGMSWGPPSPPTTAAPSELTVAGAITPLARARTQPLRSRSNS